MFDVHGYYNLRIAVRLISLRLLFVIFRSEIQLIFFDTNKLVRLKCKRMYHEDWAQQKT